MSAPAVVNPVRNVARWSALTFGLVYGYVHHDSLVALEHNRSEQIKAENRDRLVSQAKAEWSKKHTPAGGIITDPDHPDFDLEKMLIHLSETA
ncbi:hypothetical protein BG011_006766 [Mortierella polycephala]|uniref:ATP synthase F(0) complex subunit e, mitochondrial n=1 Tax=Mortierella polycephala TaxID=41804 RepID=A0A9P6QGH1_9FUNG|nr:hypothetical protein BG011_006766 [Mortierella polycephala]